MSENIQKSNDDGDKQVPVVEVESTPNDDVAASTTTNNNNNNNDSGSIDDGSDSATITDTASNSDDKVSEESTEGKEKVVEVGSGSSSASTNGSNSSTAIKKKKKKKKKKQQQQQYRRSLGGVRPSLNLTNQRALPSIDDIDPETVAEYVEQFVGYVKEYTGWDIDVNTDRVELHVADLLAIVGPALEFALSIKGKGISVDELEPFVLALIRAIVVRINVHAETRFIMDNAILEDLSVTLRNIHNALKKNWDEIDQEQQTNALLRLFTRCMPGCLAACRRRPSAEAPQ